MGDVNGSWQATAASIYHCWCVLTAWDVVLQDIQKAAIVSQQAAAQLDQLVAGTLTAQEFSDATSSDAVQVLSCNCLPPRL